MSTEILTIAECYQADRYAAEHGVAALTLMENAGRAVADEICRRWRASTVSIYCGPGNNGGDAFVVARHLAERNWDVRVALLGERAALKGDAAKMAAKWDGAIHSAASFEHGTPGLVVDGLFGAGLGRPLDDATRNIVAEINRSKPVVAIDVPSGLHGDFARPLDSAADACVEAELTVTFFRQKPAHVLMPGRLLCGEVIVASVGIPDGVLEKIRPRIFENDPALWRSHFRWPQPMAHKYDRGHAIVVSGPAHATGAARLAARGALRVGAGLVSVASPVEAVDINASALTTIMVKPFSGASGLASLLSDRRINSTTIGPACGVGHETVEMVRTVLASEGGVVLDADALTSFAQNPGELFRLLREPCVLTPHEGEFARIFPGLLAHSASRIEAARTAALTAKTTVLLKGPDTVIAGRNGRIAITTNAPPTLATAGSGDVLSGIIGGLLAQGLDSFYAAVAGAWLHGEAANRVGPGLIAEDLPEALPNVFSALKEQDE